MQLNETKLVDRHNRPTVLQKVALRAFFINDGEYYDPADISGVTIFEEASNFTPSTILSGNLISPDVDASTIKMQFGASANDSGARPFTLINPDANDDDKFESSMTGSVAIIYEILL